MVNLMDQSNSTSTLSPDLVDRLGAIARINRSLIVPILRFMMNLVDTFFSRLQQKIGIKGMAYVFVLPNLVIFSVFILFPMVTNFFYTFTGGDNLFLDQRPFVGTANLEKLFSCEDFFQPNTCDEDIFARSVTNTGIFVVTQVALMILISLLTAVLLNRNITGRGFFRSVFFYPVLLSPIVVGLIWRWILQENGLLNSLLVALDTFLIEHNWAGILQDGKKISFLASADWARLWVVIISVWSLMGFYTLILLAGLQAIPLDMYEAASIDGAGNWRKFVSITLPLLMPTMLVVIVLSVIRAVQVFDVVFAFTGGGPGSATTYIVQYIYTNGFASPSKEFGLAAAASLVMASVLIVFTLAQLRLRGQDNVA